MSKTAVVLLPLEGDSLNRWEKKAKDNNIFLQVYNDRKAPYEKLLEADAVFGNPPAKIIKDSEKLELLSIANAGTDSYMKYKEYMNELAFTNATGAFGKSISEYMLSVLLALYKKLNIYRDNQTKGIWQDMGAEMSVFNKNVLVFGCGDIGSAFAELMKKFDCNVVGFRRRISKADFPFDKIIGEDELEEEIPKADIIALCLPGNAETAGIMNEKRISLMKKESVLINTGRGILIDTQALLDACENKKIYGAALDVYESEPPALSDRVWNTENIILTPHISGGSFGHLEETYDKIEDILYKNFCAWTDGGEYINVVDKETGYKK